MWYFGLLSTEEIFFFQEIIYSKKIIVLLSESSKARIMYVLPTVIQHTKFLVFKKYVASVHLGCKIT
jgi:hypothetical protein